MNYEVVKKEAILVAGIGATTSNDDPNMYTIIGGLWQKLFADSIYNTIENKLNSQTIALYSDYVTDVNGEYQVTVGCAVTTDSKRQQNLTYKVIPAGTYARFETVGNQQTAVADLWNTIWQTPLDRSYTGDYEEYYPSEDPEHTKIVCYIALKD